MHANRSVSRLVLLFAAAGLAVAANAESAFESDQSVIQIVSTNVQGKNVYIPSTIVVVGGRPHTLSLFNTTEVPHGFRIGALDLETVLPPKVEQQLALPELEGGKVYHVHCQLHPAHRTATLVVLPGGTGGTSGTPAPPPSQPGKPILVE